MASHALRLGFVVAADNRMFTALCNESIRGIAIYFKEVSRGAAAAIESTLCQCAAGIEAAALALERPMVDSDQACCGDPMDVNVQRYR